MFVLDLLPVWVFYFLMVAGVLGLIVSTLLIPYITPFNQFKELIAVLSVVTIIAGSYFAGADNNQKVWEAKVKDLEHKVELAEQKAKTVNEVVKYKYVDRVKVVTEVQTVVQDRIKEVATVIDKQCTVSSEAIELLNAAAVNAVTEKK
jgi:hypothetical protein